MQFEAARMMWLQDDEAEQHVVQDDVLTDDVGSL